MSKADVQAVFEKLNQVFAGDVEYDEALMELDFHTAQVRKQYPALFTALSRVGTVQMPAGEAPIQRGDASAPAPTRVETQPPPEPEVSVEWSDWAPADSHRMNVDEEVLVHWDNDKVPMSGQSGEPITLRGATGRSRFQVIGISVDQGLLRLKKVAVLPLTG